MTPELGTVLTAAIAAMEAAGARWALVGGLAVSIWATPRSTRDVDLYAALDELEPGALKTTLESRGFHVPAMEDELQYFGVFRCRSHATGVFLDVFNSAGPLGEAIIDRRVQVDDGVRRLWVISPEDLVILKAFSDRDRDFDDLVQLLRVRHEDMDMAYIEHWVRALDESVESDEVSERLHRAKETVEA